jgi:hypothetical protein
MTSDSEDNGGQRPGGRTTIVGGRPPGGDAPLGAIPRTIEILLQNAAVDPEFRKKLLDERGAAAQELRIVLAPAETALLAAIPREQLEAVISRTKVSDKMRSLLVAGAVTLAAVGVCAFCLPSLGSSPDLPPPRPSHPATRAPTSAPATTPSKPSGDEAAVPPPPSATSQPAPPTSRGIRPDLPPRKPG